ncbi:MdlB ABC-type multidrug transport system, ATPase and permease components [Candidatus Nanopelagicaceae bacterium]
MSINQNVRKILKSVRKLDKSTKIMVALFTSVQITLSFLDLLGVALLGLVGAISISGIQTGQSSIGISKILEKIALSSYSFQQQVAILAIAATVVLFIRTALSIYISRKSLFYFARKSATLSSSLTSRLLSRDLLFLQRRTSQETLFALTNGCNFLYIGMMANLINLVSDIFLLFVLSITALIFQPEVAILLFILLVTSSFILHLFLNKKARMLGMQDAESSIAANMKILESLAVYREIYVHNQRTFYADEVERLRIKSSTTQAEIAFLPNISRYVVEVSMLVGALCVSAVQFILFDVTTAITTLTLFLAAGSRLAPALLRVQQGSLGIRNALGGMSSTLELISELDQSEKEMNALLSLTETISETIHPDIEISNLYLKYPNSENYSLRNINLYVPSKKVIAIVGPSAAGKTSLVDVLLGIISPTSGEVKISSLSPMQVIQQWPTAISYVPQSVFVADASLKENIALGCADLEISEERVLDAIARAQLTELLSSLPEGLNTQLGENGNTLSGGQRQRLGIARALYSRPKIIVLDEATSALDAETEHLIADSILNLKDSATVILIAHRLSTVRSADLVCYMENGEIKHVGTFEEVRNQVPQFNQQAKLMGL